MCQQIIFKISFCAPFRHCNEKTPSVIIVCNKCVMPSSFNSTVNASRNKLQTGEQIPHFQLILQIVAFPLYQYTYILNHGSTDQPNQAHLPRSVFPDQPKSHQKRGWNNGRVPKIWRIHSRKISHWLFLYMFHPRRRCHRRTSTICQLHDPHGGMFRRYHSISWIYAVER